MVGAPPQKHSRLNCVQNWHFCAEALTASAITIDGFYDNIQADVLLIGRSTSTCLEFHGRNSTVDISVAHITWACSIPVRS